MTTPQKKRKRKKKIEKSKSEYGFDETYKRIDEIVRYLIISKVDPSVIVSSLEACKFGVLMSMAQVITKADKHIILTKEWEVKK